MDRTGWRKAGGGRRRRQEEGGGGPWVEVKCVLEGDNTKTHPE